MRWTPLPTAGEHWPCEQDVIIQAQSEWKYRIAVSVCESPIESSKRFLPPSKTEWAWDFQSAVPSSNYITALFGRKTATVPEPRSALRFRCLIDVPRSLTTGTGDDSSKNGPPPRQRSPSNQPHSFFVSSFFKTGMSSSSNTALCCFHRPG